MSVKYKGRLHDTTRAIYYFILEYKETHDGNTPSVREIAEGAGMRSTSNVKYALESLEELELIKCTKGKDRSIQVVGGQWVRPMGGIHDLD